MGKVKTVTVCDVFSNLSVFVIKFGAGAASRYGSGSTKMMRLRLWLLNTGKYNTVYINALKVIRIVG
jgi:hypothetical protein